MAAKSGWRNKKYQKHVMSLIQPGVELICFDTETSGLSAEKNHIIEIAAMRCRFRDDNLLDVLEELHLYINPGYLLPPKIVELTGITDEDLADCPCEDEVFDEIRRFFSGGPIILCGHNVSFDIRFLSAMFERHGYKLYDGDVFDTLEMSRDIFCNGEVQNHKLGTLAEYCGIADGVQFHSAIDDVRVTQKLFQLLAIEYASREYEDQQNKHRPKVISIKFWEGYKGFSRIYVDTSAGSLYYDVRRKTWYPKDVDLATIDVSYVESECLNATNSATVEEFSKFTDRIVL